MRAQAEARRVMRLCHVCGFCTGFCDVFRAAQRRPRLTPADLDYLANLCHNCRACWYACQYAPPHEFAVNVPAALARVRQHSYRRYAWPRALAPLQARSAATTAALGVATPLLVTLLTALLVPSETLFATPSGAGSFYAVIPRGVLVTVSGMALGAAVLAVLGGTWRFWRAISAEAPPATPLPQALPEAIRDALVLRNLQGGGCGCNDTDERFSGARRRLHATLLYGFLLTLAATLSAALAHYGLGATAPHPLWSPPVLLGTGGGLGMTLGGLGLIRLKRRSDPEPTAAETLPADYALLSLLLATAVTGLALLALRETPAAGLLLALHWGTALGLFLALPISKLVHAPYRSAALLRAAMERRTDRARGLSLTSSPP